ncbi:MAG: SDR family oxidoreductase [Verrucomicrobiota bacterium]
MSSPLHNKRALVTGATSGIGRAVAGMLAQHGANVIATGRNESALAELDAMENISTVAADLRDTNSMDSLFETAGDLDILVNTAGVAPFAHITSGKFEDWKELLDVNVLALTYCCQKALAAFPAGGGQIVNLSSLSGHRVPPTGGFYAATKFAVRAITESLRLELAAQGNQTRVACVSPGFVDTPLLDVYFKGREDELAKMRKEMPMLTPRDVAESVLHILESPPQVEVNDVLLRPKSQAT